MKPVSIAAGAVTVGERTVAVTGAPVDALRLAALFAEEIKIYTGNAGDITHVAEVARSAGLTAEAFTVDRACDLWYSAEYKLRPQEDRPVLTDWHVQDATFALLRLGDSIPTELRNRIRIDHRLWPSSLVITALSRAIAGWPKYEKGRNYDAVEKLPEEHRRALRDDYLPALSAALLKLRESVDALIVNAYEQGVRDGSDLLAGLASGSVSPADFNAKTTR